ncbi:unnamed protein product [marine sediment metagenome]|uniref:Uncharacterized protein n=1 Tax=marine sediment metagenome TaxID=412755 RepID=X1B301_9ZZZZ
MNEIILDEGKYKFYIKDHVLCCDRYGEAWRDFVGDNAVYILFNECLELKQRLSKVEDSLLKMETLWKNAII